FVETGTRIHDQASSKKTEVMKITPSFYRNFCATDPNVAKDHCIWKEYRRNKRPTHVQHTLECRLLAIAYLPPTTINPPISYFPNIIFR
ncbi:MAG: hypothetical protein ACI9GW_001478, partial [Halieaceae bacterium]